MKNNNIFRVLSSKPFLFLWLAEIFAQIAMNMVNFVLIVVAFKLTNSNAAVSGVVLAFTIPAIFFGILAGVYVDRWDKKTVLNVSNIMRAILVAFLIVFHTNLPMIYILTFLIAIATQFFIPAETPMIPLLVKKELLLPANGLFGAAIYGSMLIAYALTGASLLFFKETEVFIFLSVLFICASFFVMLIKVPKGIKEEEREVPTVTAEIKKAFEIIAKTGKISHSLFLLTLSALLILVLAVIGPGYAKQVLGITVEEFPLIFISPAAFGMVVCALVLGSINSNFKEKSATYGLFLSSIGLFLLPFGQGALSAPVIRSLNSVLPAFFRMDNMHIVVFIAFVLGVANALVFVPSNTILQEETSDMFRGKMYGFLNSFVGVVSLFPIILIGGLADVFGVSSVLIGIAFFLLLLGFYRLVRF